MYQQLIIRVKARGFRVYTESFSFFHSNSINKILTSKKIDQVILFRDLEFFDNQTEYLKRALYQNQETHKQTHIKQQLTDYYDKNMTPPSPSLLTLDQYQYLDSRNRKILKLCIMKEKSQGQKQKRKSFIQSNGLKGSNTSCVDILHKLDQTNLSNLADSQRFQSQQQSYDSDVHNVFSNFQDKAKSLFASVNDLGNDYRQVLFLRNIKESQLIINFKLAHEPQSDANNFENEPKINITQISRSFSETPLKFNKNSKEHEHEKSTHQQLNFKSQNRNHPLVEQSNFNSQIQNMNIYQKGHLQQAQSCFQSGSFGTGYQQPPSQSNNSLPIKTLVGSETVQNNKKIITNRITNNYVTHQQPLSLSTNFQSLNGLPQLNDPQNVHFISQTQTIFPKQTNSFSSKNNQNSDSMSGHVNQSNNPGNKTNSQSSNAKVTNTLNKAASPAKKGKLSFMEYYHSVPIKNPTNILEKYIKRKK